jgi:equilibrative nucleoside transporter 1/2/3
VSITPEIVTTDLEEYTEEENEVAVFSAIKGPATCIFLTFTVTLCLFPSWLSQLRSSHECETHFRLSNDLYVPFSFVVFNLGDLAGRLMSEKVPVERLRHMSLKLVIAAACRVVFFPLLLFCVSEASDRHMMTIESDFYSLVVQFLFAFTNGILLSCSFMYAPHLVAHNTGMQERASEMMTFAVYFGLLSGSLLSFPFSQLVSQL